MTTVKWLNSQTPGAPTLSGTAGDMLSVLNACLVNGWGSAVVDSIVVVSNVATVTKSGHPFSPGQIAEIAGAAPAGLNGQKRVLTTTASTYTFDATGIPDQTATGVITHKVAALGWTKPFADAGNVGVYRLNSVEGTGSYLRVTDSGTSDARCVGYESMSDLSTGVGPFPTGLQQPGGTYWPKSGTANSTTRPWILVGDDRGFYLCSSPYQDAGMGGVGSSWKLVAYFGDFTSNKAVDPDRAMISGSSTPTSSSLATTIRCMSFRSSSVTSAYLRRGTSGIGGAVQLYRTWHKPVPSSADSYSGDSVASLSFPNPADNGFYVSPVDLSEVNMYRGQAPGFYCTAHNLYTGTPLPETSQINGVVGLPGRTLMSIATSNGVGLVDITGPWR